ncbi:MAG: PEGA domain-containing protein, partial [Fibrobacter sp.]|nr:PEGA domain-containing protein [Fibrobacter sp.]
NGSAASFVVKHQETKRDFRVFTPDYDVVVTGTYFSVEPDVSGKVLTRVFEGSVRIESSVFGDTVLKAGQGISYNEISKGYEIRDGGVVVKREELGQIPSVDQLLRQQPLKITSNVRGAEVRINGRVVGYSPLVTRQPVGLYHIALSKRGFLQTDTTVNISQGDSVQLVEFGLERVRTAKVTKSVAAQKTNADKPVAEPEHHETSDPESIVRANEPKNISEPQRGENVVVGAYRSSGTQMSVPQATVSSLIEQTAAQEDNTEEVYLKAQKLEKTGNWKKAITLYEQIFNNQIASKLRREDALFSIGKLKAENEANVAEAQKVFLSYLANFPNGSYSGESWLRLAELEFPVSPENSIQYYLKYFDKFPWHPRISELQNRVGAIYLQQKKYNEAVVMFRRALNNLDPSKVEEQRYISSNLHQALQKKGDTYQAEQVWNRYLANVPDMP